jgi:DNA primase
MDLFSFIKSNVDILDVISQYTALKKTGSLYWKGRCPFHHEKTASFTVSPHKNIFYCFGCHATGDVINFIEKIEHLNPFEATQYLAERYNLDIPQEIQQQQGPHNSKNYYQLCHSFATWCNNMLPKYPLAASYLEKRKILAPTIQHFMLGFFPGGSRNIAQLISYISTQGFTVQNLLDAHILQQGKQGLYSPYENRIIFPIKEHLGKICGFGGRIFLPDDTRVKYYNSMDSSYFKKGKLLFGIDSAKHDIQKTQKVIIVEGYMDCIALWQFGLKNAVATLGTACSTDHLQQLTKHAQTIYLLYDADNAGKQAVLKLASSCWQLDLDLKVITLPAGQDPASLLEQKMDISQHVDRAQDIFNFFVDAKSSSFNQDSIKQKMSILHELLDIIAQETDSLKQNILLIKASQSLQIPLEILKNEYTNRYKVQPTTTPYVTESLESKTLGSLEEQIVGTIAHNPHIMTQEHELLLTTGLSAENLKIVQAIIDHKKKHDGECKHSIEEMIDPSLIENLRSIIFKAGASATDQTFQSLMQQFKKKYWKSIIQTIKIKIFQAQKDLNDQEVQRLLAMFEQLKIEVYKNGRL